MKRKYIYLSLLGAALALTSCSSEEVMSPSTEEGTMTIELNLESRANLLNELPNGSEYFVACNQQTSLVKYSDGTSSIASPISLQANYVSAIAFYPYSADGEKMYNHEGIWPINAYDGIDYMYGQSNNVNYTNPTARITLHHALTYVKFNITTNDYLAEEIKDGLKIESILLENVAMKGMIEFGTNFSLIPTEENGTIEFGISDGDISKGAVEVGSFCFPYHKSDSSDKRLTLILNKGIGEVEVIIPNGKWTPNAGSIYTYYITIDGAHKGTLLADVTISSWQNINSDEIIVK